MELGHNEGFEASGSACTVSNPRRLVTPAHRKRGAVEQSLVTLYSCHGRSQKAQVWRCRCHAAGGDPGFMEASTSRPCELGRFEELGRGKGRGGT